MTEPFQKRPRPVGFPARVLRSFSYAFAGLAHLVRAQHNARVHLFMTIVVVGFAIALGVSAIEASALTLAITAVWGAETINTALETLLDAVRPEFDPLVGRAKDLAAAAVLIASIGAAGVGLFTFGPKLWLLWTGPAGVCG